MKPEARRLEQGMKERRHTLMRSTLARKTKRKDRIRPKVTASLWCASWHWKQRCGNMKGHLLSGHTTQHHRHSRSPRAPQAPEPSPRPCRSSSVVPWPVPRSSAAQVIDYCEEFTGANEADQLREAFARGRPAETRQRSQE